ncbi:MAG: M23 family metallopeptidase, partial [Heliobacteriaceae bacterium]|nr:M23 family metallopeptidase [Heliobacteriaceae bacterium]
GPMAHPLPNYVDITSPFGPRIHPLLKTPRNHSGVDFSSPAGRPVKAAQTGVVIFAGEMGPNGNTVIVDHGDGVSTLYAHFSVIGVKENQTVQKGQVVGNVGSTGWSTGPHLHFEVRVNGNPVNPLGYIGG